jgi:siderophore synthetase component
MTGDLRPVGLEQRVAATRAEQQIMLDLVNAALAEDLGGLVSRSGVRSHPDVPVGYPYLLESPQGLLIPVTPGMTQRWRSPKGVVWAQGEQLGPEQFLAVLLGAQYPAETLSRLGAELRLAIRQTALGDEPRLLGGGLNALERLAAWRDRPFHPTAKAKVGWDEDTYRRFAPECGAELTLQWIALRRDHVLTQTQGGPLERLLTPVEQAQVHSAMEQAGLAAHDYLALPIHPWQLAQVLPGELAPEIEAGICVPLEVAAGRYCPSSSLRSLAPAVQQGPHVKLPVSVESLGAIRSLPALYLQNGEKGQRLLAEAVTLDPELHQRLQLCDETAWWAFWPAGTHWWDDRPRHLSCMIRRYPQVPDAALVPMSALAVPAFWTTMSDPLSFFAAGAERFCDVVMRLLRLGIMPEIHGQNVLLLIQEGAVTGLVLRDHDTVRTYRPWLERAGLTDPGYIVKSGRPNSLYNDRPELLIAYLQTLGLQVNLGAAAQALGEACSVPEDRCWQTIETALQRAVEAVPWSMADRRLVTETLFASGSWPFKQVLTPLLERTGSAGNAMPSGWGQAPNPFRRSW